MESTYQKYVNILYLMLGVLLAYIVFTGGMKLVAVTDFETRFRQAELALRGISVVAGIVLYVVLYRHEQANQFFNEAVAELTRVSWPTNKEVGAATFIVIVMVVISGFILGLVDSGLERIWTWIFR